MATLQRTAIGVGATAPKIEKPKTKKAPVKRRPVHTHDATFIMFRNAVQRQFDVGRTEHGPLLFRTNVDAQTVYATFLARLETVGARNAHKCDCCRTFFRHYAGLVFVKRNGEQVSALFGDSASTTDFPKVYRDSVSQVKYLIDAAQITGPFLNAKKSWGTKQTGEWPHMYVDHAAASPSFFFRAPRGQTVEQVEAEKIQNFQTVSRTLETYNDKILDQIVAHLSTQPVYRSEAVLGAATWLRDVYEKLKANFVYVAASDKQRQRRDNLIWREAVKAPVQCVNIRGGVLGTLLTDLKNRVPLNRAILSFEKKMQPDKFQRPQALPTQGAVNAATKLVKKLGVEKAFERRFARLDEIRKLWEPIQPKQEPSTYSTGIFSGILTKDAAPTPMRVQTTVQTMTFSRFRRTILPNVLSMEIMITKNDRNFGAFLTAVHADAPPIFEWDHEHMRNPVSWYTHVDGSYSEDWNVKPGWNPVTAVSLFPNLWEGQSYKEFNKALFVIENCWDHKGDKVGMGLFPEILKSDLHPIRKVIEEYSNSHHLHGHETATACGLMFEDTVSVRIRATVVGNVQPEFIIEKWD